MQIGRLFEIVYLLLDQKKVTAKDLALRFEVSARTIYRDIETLSETGIPVYMTKGKGGGISILPGFVLNKAVITEAEKKDIMSSLHAINAIQLDDAGTALEKLNSLFGESNTDWIEVDFSAWANAEEETNHFQMMKEAILAKKEVQFTYASAKGQNTQRVVEPLKICFKGGAWYLYGYCKERKDFRFFKLRRIKELNMKETSFLQNAPKQVFKKESVFSGEFVQLKMKLAKELAYRVYDEFESYKLLEDGSFLVEIHYPKGEWLFYYVASFGSQCEVLEPLEVRNDVRDEFQKIVKNYLEK